MGRIQKTRGPADRLADDLRWYFCNSESELGLRSSFGAFVDLAMSGVQPGGRANGAEDRAIAIADRVHKPTEAHRGMRRRLHALGANAPRLVEALFAAYGPTDWPKVADAAFGRGTGERLARAFGADRIGVALVTERLARAHAEWTGPPAEVVADGLRWVLEGVSGGEGLYRCAGPLVSTHERQRPAETDAALRRRAVREIGGYPLRAEHAALYDATGEDLDAVARAWTEARRRPAETMIDATLQARRPPPEAPRGSRGAVLRALVVAAYPQRLPKTAAQKTAMANAMQQVNTIRDEATMLLERARAALPELDNRPTVQPAPVRAPESHVPPALRRKSKPVVAYEAFVAVADVSAPSRAAAARWM